MNSSYRIIGNRLKHVRSCLPQTSSDRIRPSMFLFQIVVFLSFPVILFIVHSYYYLTITTSDNLHIQKHSLHVSHPGNPGVKFLSNHLQYVSYNETELEERALHIINETMWMYVKPAMTSNERFTVHQLLREFVKICHVFNITDYFLFSGSLLGSYRHHGLQPWDDDVDILMKYSQQAAIVKAFNAYANQSKDVDVTFWYHRLKLFHRSRSVAIGQEKYRWPYLDLSFYLDNETHIWEYDALTKMNYHVVEKSLIFPLHPRPFEAVMVNCPRDAYAVLRLLYPDSGCVPLTWIHKKERMPTTKFQRFECDLVAPIYPFVHRKAADSGIEESLWVNDTLLYKILIEEPMYAVTDPYTLRLIAPVVLNASVILT